MQSGTLPTVLMAVWAAAQKASRVAGSVTGTGAWNQDTTAAQALL